jgi:hypothetical protein
MEIKRSGSHPSGKGPGSGRAFTHGLTVGHAERHDRSEWDHS